MTHKNTVIDVYDAIAKEYYVKREKLSLIPELEKLCEYIPQHGLILDAGCGNARDTYYFWEKGYNAIGIDLSDGQLSFAYKRTNNTSIIIQKQDILNLRFPQCSFDGIWCCAVLPHFTNDEIKKILYSFNDILKPNGIAIVTFKQGNGENLVIENEFGGVKRYTNYHSEYDIIAFSELSNFEIVEMYSYNEQKRFSIQNRNIDFIVAVLRKKNIDYHSNY